MTDHLDHIRQQAQSEGWSDLTLRDGVWWGFPDEFATFPQPYPGNRQTIESMSEALENVAEAMEQFVTAAENIQAAWAAIKREEALWAELTREVPGRRRWWRVLRRSKIKETQALGKHMTTEELKNLILQFAASCTLADDMADVANSLETLLERIGFEEEWRDLDHLRVVLYEQGVTTLHGNELIDRKKEVSLPSEAIAELDKAAQAQGISRNYLIERYAEQLRQQRDRP